MATRGAPAALCQPADSTSFASGSPSRARLRSRRGAVGQVDPGGDEVAGSPSLPSIGLFDQAISRGRRPWSASGRPGARRAGPPDVGQELAERLRLFGGITKSRASRPSTSSRGNPSRAPRLVEEQDPAFAVEHADERLRGLRQGLRRTRRRASKLVLLGGSTMNATETSSEQMICNLLTSLVTVRGRNAHAPRIGGPRLRRLRSPPTCRRQLGWLSGSLKGSSAACC